ncbi:hypothetical protein HHL27_13730 [Novosphingobium sp. TW-4]|uniref:Uncharacterized protein n=1 Tax=Novosphingobium olei TaxID=2728851 RepID=A0A7Y0GA57_9SPHN|nr:hypothetical protein [Novosphingobium olei]
MAQLNRVSDLAQHLDRLAGELSCAGDLDGTSAAYFQSRLLPVLAALADVVKAARVALAPALQEEAYRSDGRSGGPSPTS